MMNPAAFVRGIDNPDLIQFCENCRKTTCKNGLCEEYAERYYEIYGRNTMRGGRLPRKLELFGVSMTVKEWAEFAGLGRTTIYTRLSQGMSLQDALGGLREEDVMELRMTKAITE